MILEVFRDFFLSTGLCHLDLKSCVMIVVALIFIYLAIRKKFEPMLLVPIGFGMLLSNIPLTGIFDAPSAESAGGLFYYFYHLDELGILPPLIFMGIGAMTDFSPLLANPKSLLLGAAAQVGIFITFMGASLSGFFTAQQASTIGFVGGADGRPRSSWH